MEATIETSTGLHTGYSGDCLPPGWFDKTPGKDFDQQIREMLETLELAQQVFLQESRRPDDLFSLWQAGYQRVHDWARDRGYTPLLASFGVSMVERAIMDAVARSARLSLGQAVRQNVYGIRAEGVFSELSGLQPRDWLPELPREMVYVRHTVGLADPLTRAEIAPDQRLNDGFPESLEEYIQQSAIRYLKVKVSNDLDRDLHRLEVIASLIERHRGGDYRITLDGNEQYASAGQFDRLISALMDCSRLQTLWSNTLWIEQPLERSIALDAAHTSGIRDLGQMKPVIIDESDGELDSFERAVELGYRGVSSKNCKGPIKSLLNAGLVWHKNRSLGRAEYVISGEDLCTVGVVPTQSDLCLTATLGLEHVERNGHHYHRGLSYMNADEQQAALAAHGDLYEQRGDVVAPRLSEGRFHIASLQCPGYGFDTLPQFQYLTSADRWPLEGSSDDDSDDGGR
jgi:hypothetical protein